MNIITTLQHTHDTVFTISDIEKLFPKRTKKSISQFLHRAKKDGRLLNPRKGIWTLPIYSMKHLAGKLFPGGYISLTPVLFQAGVSFQFYGNTVQSIRIYNRDISFNNQNYTAQSIKKSIYENPLCIQEFDGYREAMPERALCDLVYLWPKTQLDNPQYFDNQQSKLRLEKLLPLYPKTTQKYVRKLIATKI